MDDEHEQLIQDCMDRDTKLTEWEQGFIDSLAKQIAQRPLSERQAERLEAIWERVTSR